MYDLVRLKERHCKGICIKENGLCLQLLITTLHSSLNITLFRDITMRNIFRTDNVMHSILHIQYEFENIMHNIIGHAEHYYGFE
jgi:hypothetical protein